jgi:hypothetical protein
VYTTSVNVPVPKNSATNAAILLLPNIETPPTLRI